MLRVLVHPISEQIGNANRTIVLDEYEGIVQ